MSPPAPGLAPPGGLCPPVPVTGAPGMGCCVTTAETGGGTGMRGDRGGEKRMGIGEGGI